MGKNSHIVKFIALGGILAAMAALLKFLSIESNVLRITFYDIPVMFAGIVLGPVFGPMVGLAADVSKLSVYGFNLMTVSSMMWGFIPGFVFFIYFIIVKELKLNYVLLFITILITSIICFSINTYQLYLWSSWGAVILELPSRIIIAVIKLPIQFFTIALVFNRTKHLLPNYLIQFKPETTLNIDKQI